MTHDYLTIGRGVLSDIKSTFFSLQMEIEKPENIPVDLEMNIDVQDGLEFQIMMNLQGDELHLHIDEFHCSWFPCDDINVANDFMESVKGMIYGEYRVKLICRNGKLFSAMLQKPEVQSWKTIARYGGLISLWPFGIKTISYVQNSKTDIIHKKSTANSLR
ncbi:MAG: hypothetical protein HOH19_04050 [Kordiimonadaceae bacterium]|nr:hypothetical protein [Kordiimonadaceae bacterium]